MITDTERTTITLAHSPDSDDAFMFYGLATNKIDLVFHQSNQRRNNNGCSILN